MGQGGGSPATPLTLREACAPPHPGLKPHGRLVAAPRAPSGARRCKSAPAVGNMRPAPALVLAALCLLALPAAAAAAYFGSVPVASPLSACLVPVPIPARPRTQPFAQTGPRPPCGRTLRPDLYPWLSELRLHLPFPNPSLGPLPHPVSQPGGCQTPA